MVKSCHHLIENVHKIKLTEATSKQTTNVTQTIPTKERGKQAINETQQQQQQQQQLRQQQQQTPNKGTGHYESHNLTNLQNLQFTNKTDYERFRTLFQTI